MTELLPVVKFSPASSRRNLPCPSQKITIAPPLWAELMFAVIVLPLYS